LVIKPKYSLNPQSGRKNIFPDIVALPLGAPLDGPMARSSVEGA